ncbi:GntR family transcriptional regulator [Novosphingobium sp.]|uniref:GntR family transcriptional regulator n=1 Tax=Novosphingobium sp. TaxID=1874826 RepID=UPI0038BB894C
MPSPTTTARKPAALPSSEEIARAIVQGLEAGEFAPGQRLVEADLCLRFGVGRQAVREALQRLKMVGVVDIVPNRGAHILHMTPEQAALTLEVTELLFGLAARTAARRIAAGSGTATLEHAIGELDACADGAAAVDYMRARRHLFGALAQIADNPELTRLLDQTRVHVLRGQFGFAGLRQDHARELAAIGRLVLAGQCAEAEAQARAHVERIRLHLERI